MHAVCPCAGDDEWCVISMRTTPDRRRVAAVIGGAEGCPSDRAELIAAVSQWTAGRDKDEVADRLQGPVFPPAPMNRAADVAADPQIVFRHLFTDMVHPLFDAADARRDRARAVHPHPARRAAARAHARRAHPDDLPEGPRVDAEQIDALIADGVLFTSDDDRRTLGRPAACPSTPGRRYSSATAR